MIHNFEHKKYGHIVQQICYLILKKSMNSNIAYMYFRKRLFLLACYDHRYGWAKYLR